MTTTKPKIEKLTRILDQMLEQSKYALTEFKTKYENDPCHAFEWSTGAFEAAGRQFAAQQMHGWIENIKKNAPADATIIDEVVDGLLAEISQRVREGARSPRRSTSVQSNEMAVYKLAAFAEVLDRMGGRL